MTHIIDAIEELILSKKQQIKYHVEEIKRLENQIKDQNGDIAHLLNELEPLKNEYNAKRKAASEAALSSLKSH